MSKKTASNKSRNNKSGLSSSDLERAPIRGKAEEEEEDGYDEEIVSKPPKELYPWEDLAEELNEIDRRTVQCKSERAQIRQPPKRATTPKDEAGQSNDSWSLNYILLLLIPIVSALFGFIYFSQSEKPAADRTISLPEFISKMENRFEGQDPQTFLILKSSLKKVFTESSKPPAPSIITVITNKGAETTASDFGAYIAQELASGHHVSINESAVRRDADDLKYDIDTEIKNKFDNRSLNVAVVDRFHNIPIGAAMIFHNYCDHENAPFKRAIFLFIVHLDRKIPENSNTKFVDTAAMEALRSIWRDASDDIVDSLITRLTVNVINIK